MEETRRNLWVGTFVLFGLAALATLIVLFGKGPTWLMAGGTYPMHVHFDEVTDIREGNLVTAKGITIGRVTRVGLIDPARFDVGVDVVIAIENQYRIPEGSSAVATEPMLGQGRPPIQIIPGDPEAAPLAAGASLRGTVRKAFDSLFPTGVVTTFETSARQIGDAAEALTPVLEELEQMLEIRSPADVDRTPVLEGNLSTAVARMDSALKHFNEVLGDPAIKSQVREAVANIHSMSEEGRRVVSELEGTATEARAFMVDARELVGKVDGVVVRLDQRTGEVSGAAVKSFDKVDQLMDQLNIISQQVKSGEGNVGRFIMDDTLYESMVITAQRLSLAVEEFRELLVKWKEGKIRVGL